MVGDSRVPLERAITTVELSRRTSRRPNYEIESRALAELMAAMANQPNADSILQKLVDTALELCRAQSAGSSILEKGTNGDVFCWRAVAGSIYRGELMSRKSPCGTVIDRDVAMHTTYQRSGPSVTPPRRKGFGRTAMVRMIEHTFDADVDLNFDLDGVTWKTNARLAAVLQEIGSSA